MAQRSTLLFCLFVLVMWIGCAPSASVRTIKTSVTPAQVQESVRMNHERVQSMKGMGRITVETPEVAQSGSFTLLFRKPDSILVKLEGPFGIEVGSALLTRTEFLFYNSLQNKLISGAMNGKNLSRVLRVNLNFDELINLFTGGDFFSDDRSTPESFTVEEEQFVLTYRHQEGSRRYWIDPSSLLILKVQHLDGEGKLFVEQRFSNYKTAEGTSVPYNVRLTQQKERRAVSISYSNVLVNTNAIQFTLNIPESAERVHLQ